MWWWGGGYYAFILVLSSCCILLAAGGKLVLSEQAILLTLPPLNIIWGYQDDKNMSSFILHLKHYYLQEKIIIKGRAKSSDINKWEILTISKTWDTELWLFYVIINKHYLALLFSSFYRMMYLIVSMFVYVYIYAYMWYVCCFCLCLWCKLCFLCVCEYWICVLCLCKIKQEKKDLMQI